jgi:hydroxylamine dehydrogenase
LPAYVAYAGTKDLTPEQDAQYKAIPEAALGPIQQRSVLYDIEDPRLTPFACANCHSIGRPAEDGSVGRCQKCHLRHAFSLEQARKPETCNNCHIGPDHPQWEIYFESAHGIAYSTSGDTWNWEAEPGERLTWYSFAPISDRRPTWEDNKVRMQDVCRACHNQEFLDSFYNGADQAVAAVNDYVKQSDQIMAPLKDQGLISQQPFSEPIQFTYYKLWHHWGRTAKFGTWMQGPDYVQWHGVFEILSDLADLREMVDDKLNAAGVAAPTPTPGAP